MAWSPKQLELMEIMARGQRDEDGEKMTLREIAKKLHITRKTLYAWRNKEGFSEACYELAMKKIGDRLPNIGHSMADAAELKGDVAAARLTLELCGKMNRQAEMVGEFEKLFVALGATTVVKDG